MFFLVLFHMKKKKKERRFFFSSVSRQARTSFYIVGDRLGFWKKF